VIADGQFIIAEFYYKKEAYQAAVSRFEALLKEFPDYKRADETLFLIGRSYRQLKNAQKAQEVFAVLLEKYPSSRFAANVRKGVK
jgi:outer membrane protein assembly factor BamD